MGDESLHRLIEIAPGIFYDDRTGNALIQGAAPEGQPVLDGVPLQVPAGEQLVEITEERLRIAAAAILNQQGK